MDVPSRPAVAIAGERGRRGGAPRFFAARSDRRPEQRAHTRGACHCLRSPQLVRPRTQPAPRRLRLSAIHPAVRRARRRLPGEARAGAEPRTTDRSEARGLRPPCPPTHAVAWAIAPAHLHTEVVTGDVVRSEIGSVADQETWNHRRTHLLDGPAPACGTAPVHDWRRHFVQVPEPGRADHGRALATAESCTQRPCRNERPRRIRSARVAGPSTDGARRASRDGPGQAPWAIGFLVNR